MLQSGVGTRDLDVRWVSSLSWYFLTLFGLQPVYNFILGNNNGEHPSPQRTRAHTAAYRFVSGRTLANDTQPQTK